MRIHFAYFYNYAHFASKQTSARIDFLRQGERLVSRKGTQNVKILTENKTIVVASCAREWAMGRIACTLTGRLNRFDTALSSWRAWNNIAFKLILLKKIRERKAKMTSY